MEEKNPGSGVAIWIVLFLLVVSGQLVPRASGVTLLDQQLQFGITDPNGYGVSNYTVFYHIPQQAEVGSSYTVGVKLYVQALTGLKLYLQDYNITVNMAFKNGKVASGTVGVSAIESASGLGALQLFQGGNWGPVNVTIPVTERNTGLTTGQEALGTISIQLTADVWYKQPIDFYKPEAAHQVAGYTVVTDGTPNLQRQPNYAGFALTGVGVVFLVVAFATRRRPKVEQAAYNPKKE